jgi:hypothetical protein
LGEQNKDIYLADTKRAAVGLSQIKLGNFDNGAQAIGGTPLFNFGAVMGACFEGG